MAGALALEGFGANLSVLHPGVEKTRPHPSFAAASARTRALLEGSYLWGDGAARNLQDPLTFRSTVAVQAVGREALDHALAVLAIELNAAQGNPLVDAATGRIVSVASYESLPLAAALDYVRVALASVFTAASERSVKLLDTPWSGLPTGLSADPDRPDLGLSIHAITVQALTAEASLLAQPVSFTVVSTSGAEGIEDRATLLPLSARRLAAMVDLGEGVIAVEALVGVQAIDLRGRGPLGRGTRRLTTWSGRGSRSPARAVAHWRIRACCAGSCARTRSPGPRPRMPGESGPRRPPRRRAPGCYPCGMDHLSCRLPVSQFALVQLSDPPLKG